MKYVISCSCRALWFSAGKSILTGSFENKEDAEKMANELNVLYYNKLSKINKKSFITPFKVLEGDSQCRF